MIKRGGIAVPLLFISFFSVSAQPPVDTLYRLDQRSPREIIAAGGFQPWQHPSQGGDMDLISHLEGTSVHAHTSGFVSTSDRLAGIVSVLDAVTGGAPDAFDPRCRIFLYSIRPDPANAYPVSLSIRHAINHTPRQDRAQSLTGLTRQLLQDRHEVAVLGGIPSGRIITWAEITGTMLRQHSREEMTAPLFWAHRWTPLATYDPAYDRDRLLDEPYPDHLMRDPGRGAYFQVPLRQAHDEAPLRVSLTMSCQGVAHPPPEGSIMADCCARTHVRYEIYDDTLTLFLATRHLIRP